MAYAQIDVGAMRHPKILQLSDGAFRLWVAGLCYCQEQLTDGVLAAPTLYVLGARVSEALVDELLRAGLWERQADTPDGGPGGYVVHDYLVWNKSREKVHQLKDAARDRAEASRQRRKEEAIERATRPKRAQRVRRTSREGFSAHHAHGAEPIRNDTQRNDPIRSLDHQDRDQGGAPAAPAPPHGPHGSHAFCGQQLHVPRYLHEDFTQTLGAQAEAYDLEAWYQQLDDRLVEQGRPALLPDRDRWLKAQFADIVRETFRGVRRFA